jgi:ferredoxin
MKFNVDWDLCDGNGVCVIEAPDLLDIDDDSNLVILAETFGADKLAQAEGAVRVCPKHALTIDRSAG